MKRVLRSLILLAVAGLLVGGLATFASARPASDGNRFKATFHETLRAAYPTPAYQIVQAVITGTGTVEGYGAATEVVAVNQDRSVTPCGAGSAVDQSIRRIVLPQGTLILRLSGIRCVIASGPVITGSYEVDGQASTGVFAGARGSGDDHVDVATGTATVEGKLKLANGA